MSELPELAARFGRPNPGVDHPSRLAGPARDAERVASLAAGEGLFELLREAFEGRRLQIGADLLFVGLGDAGVFANERLEERGRSPGGLGLDPTSLLHERERLVDLAPGRAHAGAVEEQEGAPRGVERVLHAFGERLFAGRRVSRSTREHFERKPCARALGGGGPFDGRRFPGAARRLAGVQRHVGHVRRAHQEGADLLVGTGRRGHQGIDEAPEVAQAAALLELSHEALEGLVKRRVRAVGRQVVARGRGFVAGALLRVSHLGEKARLPRGLAGCRDLCAQSPHRLCKRSLHLGVEGSGYAGRSRRQRLRRLAERGLGHSRSRRGRPPLSRDKRNLVSAMNA